MAFVCSICQDQLMERPQVLTSGQELIVLALKCGHLFHRPCVQQWFDGNGASNFHGRGTCPSCKTVSSLAEALRIFPTGDEDANLVEEQNKNLKTLIADNQKLESELKIAKEELTDLQTLLEEESMAHYDLRLEYAQVLSNIDHEKEQLIDSTDAGVKEALESSLKTEVDKLERDKKDLLHFATQLEQKQKKLLENMEAVIKESKEDQTSFFEAAKAFGLQSLNGSNADDHEHSDNVGSLIESLSLLQEQQDA